MNPDIGKSQSSTAPTLNSWKEIAVYLGRGVRTTQRWEQELRLPIHRIRPTRHSPVFAYISELDEWIRRHANPAHKSLLRYQIDDKLKERIRANLERMQRLQQQLGETRRTHQELIRELQQRGVVRRGLNRAAIGHSV